MNFWRQPVHTKNGGFHGGNVKDPLFHELLIRWFEYGCFYPVMRLHGFRVPRKPPLGGTPSSACVSGSDTEIWSYTEEVYVICEKYPFLRESLRPYIAECMRTAHEKGTSVICPLFYDFSFLRDLKPTFGWQRTNRVLEQVQ
ncbi:MAG: hypothetical protein LBP76_15355 [Treponema sp.]|nr:hypothetical protein [Treponema sp.]